MKLPLNNSSRRAALAGGAAALLMPAISTSAQAEVKGNCCGGNGPPNVKKNGTGVHVASGISNTQQVQFICPKTGLKGDLQNYYVFILDTGVTVVSYTGPGGHQLVYYTNVPNFGGIVYVVEPNYQLTLQWLLGIPPSFSARPALSSESNA